jgi:hypothetical protein
MPPRRAVPESAEDRALREVEAEDDAILKAQALTAGSPPDMQRQSESDEDTAWEYEDRTVDYDQMAPALTTQGLPQEVVQRLLITRLRPEWAPLYVQPTQSAEMADMLLRAAQYPFRLSFLEDFDDYDEMVQKAESMDRRAQKRHTQRQEQAAQMDVMHAAPDAGRSVAHIAPQQRVQVSPSGTAAPAFDVSPTEGG